MLLPLKYYDEAGRVKPALGLYLLILFICRSMLVFVAAMSIRAHSNELLSLFYPERDYLYLSLAIALPGLLSLFILGFREKIWRSNKVWLFQLLKPFLLLSILADLSLHLSLADTQYWRFSWVIAITLLLDCLAVYFILIDKHTKLMLKDWKTSITPTSLVKS